ncbi:uncharacterized protein [Temnothorax nylanderi]|uniref:uncharacterized protein n=1 Tax=Temnothorax nylanderi TaxID=102681 RepID=UPI003A8678DF
MLRGLNTGWKMPVSYNFCSKTTNTPQLIRCIKEHINKISKAGFHIIATVCDQGSTNIAAINQLLLRTDMRRNFEKRKQGQTFEVGEVEVVPLFDPPHLLKGIRNNLLTKDLAITCEGNIPKRIASWDVIKTAWLMDRAINIIRPQLKKITKEHDQTLKIDFEEGIATAEVVNFFNDLFDSLSVNSVNTVDNNLQSPVTEESVHH